MLKRAEKDKLPLDMIRRKKQKRTDYHKKLKQGIDAGFSSCGYAGISLIFWCGTLAWVKQGGKAQVNIDSLQVFLETMKRKNRTFVPWLSLLYLDYGSAEAMKVKCLETAFTVISLGWEAEDIVKRFTYQAHYLTLFASNTLDKKYRFSSFLIALTNKAEVAKIVEFSTSHSDIEYVSFFFA